MFDPAEGVARRIAARRLVGAEIDGHAGQGARVGGPVRSYTAAEAVAAGAALQCVIACTAVEGIVAREAVEGVVAIAAGKGVGEKILAGDGVVVRRADDVLDVDDHVGVGTPRNRAAPCQGDQDGLGVVLIVGGVLTGTAVQSVATVATGERVVSGSAPQRIVAAAAVQNVASGAAEQFVVAKAAGQRVVAGRLRAGIDDGAIAHQERPPAADTDIGPGCKMGTGLLTRRVITAVRGLLRDDDRLALAIGYARQVVDAGGRGIPVHVLVAKDDVKIAATAVEELNLEGVECI